MWLIDPFAANIENNNININEKENLVDLLSECALSKLNFSHLYKNLIYGSTFKMNID